MDIKNRTVVISGGSSGLGQATAEHLFQLGANVAVFDLAPAKSDGNPKGLTSHIKFFKTDVTSDADTQEALMQVLACFGAVDVCVNCAGIAPAARTLNRAGEPADLMQFNQVVAVNLAGTFNLSRLAAAHMAKNAPSGDERGVIINTASIAAYEGQIGQTAYAASKAGIIGMTLPMARDLSAKGIRVNCIAPGVMQTPLMSAMPAEVEQALSANVLFPKRLGLPLEFAKLVQHIIENTYINGETVRLDGGLRMQPK